MAKLGKGLLIAVAYVSFVSSVSVRILLIQSDSLVLHKVNIIIVSVVSVVARKALMDYCLLYLHKFTQPLPVVL